MYIRLQTVYINATTLHLKQESCAIAKMNARYALYKWIVRRCGDMVIQNYPRWRHHLEFIRIENSAIRSAVPENPTL